MANQIMIFASELALVIVLTIFLLLRQEYATGPQYLGSVGWHGGKKNR
jgi:hypothetical protein